MAHSSAAPTVTNTSTASRPVTTFGAIDTAPHRTSAHFVRAPEPASTGLLTMGILALLAVARPRRKPAEA